MRSRALSLITRVACAVSVSSLLTIGHIGCDSGSGSAPGAKTELPPEAKQATTNMENFEKEKAGKK